MRVENWLLIMIQLRIKRVLDIVLALTGLALTLPIMGLVAVAILLTSGPPVLFSQVRPGLHGKPFAVLKFRSLRVESVGPDDRILDETERTTPLTDFLRSTSLDELPQLWNVLRGEMSLVGPRPLIWAYLERYTPEQARRHDVRPGITGLAQLAGRQRMDYEERFRLDVWYVDHWSLWLDMKILLATGKFILSRRGSDSADPDFSYPKWGEDVEDVPTSREM